MSASYTVFFICSHLLGKCELMRQDLYELVKAQEEYLENLRETLEAEEEQRQIAAFFQMVADRQEARRLLQIRQENLEREQPWLPRQSLFAEPEPTLEEYLDAYRLAVSPPPTVPNSPELEMEELEDEEYYDRIDYTQINDLYSPYCC